MLVTFHHGGDEVSLQPVATRASPVVVLVVLVEDVFLDIYSLFYMGLYKDTHIIEKKEHDVFPL